MLIAIKHRSRSHILPCTNGKFELDVKILPLTVDEYTFEYPQHVKNNLTLSIRTLLILIL